MALAACLRYHLIDEGSYPVEMLTGGDSLAALLFGLETCRAAEDALPLVDRLVEWFRRRPDQGALRAVFANLICRSFLSEGAAERRISLLSDLMEVRSMLSERVKVWQREWQRQGLQQGLDEGIRRGRQAGEATILRRLLERRFGPLPAAVMERIEAVDAATLEEWSLRLLEADSLADVLR